MHSQSTRLHITNSLGGNGNYYVEGDIPFGVFTNVTIQQVEQSYGIYRQSIYLNNTRIAFKINALPQEFDDVKLYASDKLYNPSKVVLRYFNFQSPYGKKGNYKYGQEGVLLSEYMLSDGGDGLSPLILSNIL